MVALRPKQLLEIVIRARQAGHGVTVEQPRSVAAGDLAEGPAGVGECSCLAAGAVQGAEPPVEAASDAASAIPIVVVQDVCGPMHPGIGARDIWPECRRALQTPTDQRAQPREEPRRGLPPVAARSRLAAPFSSRPLSVRPEAASGARPSSVRALRTAAQ